MAKKLKEPKRTESKRSVKATRRQRRRREPKPNLTMESFVKLDRSAVLLTVFLYCLVHWTIRTLIEPVYTFEEARELLYSQSLKLGYGAGHPPLLAWLYALAAKWGGISQPVVFAIKYVLMGWGLSAYYLAARNVLVRPGMSAAALGAWAVTFQVGWAMHEDLLGGAALMAGLSTTLHAMTRILTWRRMRDWAYLGAAIGLGALAHHLYIIFPIALILAVYTSSFFRDAVRAQRLLLAVGVALAIYSPYAIWLATHGSAISRLVHDVSEGWALGNGWADRAQRGAIGYLTTLAAFTLPFSFFWVVLFWPLWLPVLYPIFNRRSTDEEQHEEAWRAIFLRSAGIAAAICLIGVAAGVEAWKGYWAMPVLFAAPLWLFAHVKRAGEFPVAIRAFAAIVVVFVVTVIAGRFVEWRLDIETCEETGCAPYAPVKAWASELERAGFGAGTIVGADVHLTGNLRAALPHARVMDASIYPGAFPPPASLGACVVVWRNTPAMPQALAAYLERDLHVHPYDHGAEGAIRRPFLLSRTKAATLYFQFAPRSDLCR